MAAKVGINGLNQIGRLVFILLLEDPDFEIVHVNDPAMLPSLANLLQEDALYAKLKLSIELKDKYLLVDGRPITVTHFVSPEDIPWEDDAVEYVIETSGMFDTKEQLIPHFSGKVQKVIAGSMNPGSSLLPVVVEGLNHAMIRDEDAILSCASATTQCVALMLKVLNDEFGIAHAFMHSVQPFGMNESFITKEIVEFENNNELKTNASNAVRGVQLAYPEMKGIFDGMDTYAPICTGAIVELTAELLSDVTTRVVKDVFQRYAHGPMSNVLDYSEDTIISARVYRNPHSAIFDAPSTKVINGRFCQILCRYDRNFVNALRIIDLLKYVYNL